MGITNDTEPYGQRLGPTPLQVDLREVGLAALEFRRIDLSYRQKAFRLSRLDRNAGGIELKRCAAYGMADGVSPGIGLRSDGNLLRHVVSHENR